MGDMGIRGGGLVGVLAAAVVACCYAADNSTDEGPSNLGDYPSRKDVWAKLLKTANPNDPFRYDRSDPPNWGKFATIVNVSVDYNNLLNIKEKEGSYAMDFYFRLWWTDDRLVYNPAEYGNLKPIVLSMVDDAKSKLWRPDTSFTNVMSVSTNALLGELTSIQPTGRVYWSRHISARLSAPFNFRMFPYDYQFLPLEIECFKYSNKQLKLAWKTGSEVLLESMFVHSQYDVKRSFHRRRDVVYPEVGLSYSALETSVLLYRDVTNFFAKLILPVFLIVLISTLSYWIDPEVAPARVGLSITCVLTQVAFSSAVSNILPRIAYMTWIDWYIFVAFIFNCFALLEYGLVSFYMQAGDKESEDKPHEKLDEMCRWLIPLSFTIVAVVMVLAGALNPEPEFL